MASKDVGRGRWVVWLLVGLLGLLSADVAAAAKAPAVKPTKVTGAPAAVAAGETFSVKVKVKNAGKRKAKAQTVQIALSRLKLTGKVKVKALAPRKAATVTARVTVPRSAAPGTYKLTACIAKACVSGATVKVKGSAPAPAPAPPARPSGDTVNLPPGPAPLPSDPGPTPTPDPGTGDPTPTPTPDPVVRDPKDAAPALDPGAATSVYDSTRFLFTGPNPIQRGVAAGAIEPQQVAVVRGRVSDRAGAPIGGVRVTVLDHPEYGQTNTRADGRFDIAVNGGGVTLEFTVAGFLPVQRALAPDWQDYETLDDIVMVPLDPNVETVDPDSTAPFQVVQGTESSDKDGERQGTLLFPKGVSGSMELPDGRTRELDEMKVRVTEFTFGEQGDEAMPGSLPANSGYTYAAEFSVDEALKAGATQVDFDKPLINYTENFIGAPVGSPVPTGYYDREQGKWVGAPNGRVIKVLGTAGGTATVDTDGDNQADAGTDIGITDAERKQLAALYTPGQELWRVLITHFTPWDHNWPYGPPPGARPPQLKEFEWKDPNDPCQQQGSAIGCETQTLQEALPVTGTDMTLNYATDRTPGWKVDETIQIPIVGPTVPPRLKGVQLTIDVGGERIEKRWCDPNFPTTGASTCKDYPLIGPNISFPYRWDGKDAYDRTVQGRVTATIRVIYVYEFNYYGATDEFSSSFSQFGSDTEVFDGRWSCGNRSGNMDTHFFCGVPVGQTITRAIGSWDARPTHGLGGWSLSEHHAYDPVERALHRGDGATIRSEALAPVVNKLAGTTNTGVGSGRGGANYPKDGQLATEANVDYMGDYVRAPDGNLYLHNGLNRNDIFRISRDGKIYLFAGNGTKGVLTGDGGAAKDAGLGTVSALAAAPDGSLLIAGYSIDNYTNVIRRVTPDGSKIEPIAGDPTARTAPLGDGKPGLQAHIGQVNDMVVAPDGTVYWVERYSGTNNWKGRLRKLAPDGIVTTVAGGGDTLPTEAGIPASQTMFGNDPKGVAVGADGSIYVALGLQKMVVRIAPDGIATRFAGKGVSNERGKIEPGGRASQSYIDAPYSVAAASDGTVYIRSLGNDVSPSSSVILKVDPSGTLLQAAGRLRGTCGAGAPDGEAATSICISNHSTTLGVDGDGGVTFADGRYLIRKLAPPLPGFDPEGLALPSSDGLEVYEFDRNGRHLRTRDGLTGAVLKSFEYDAAKRLTGVVDAYGNRTRVERDASGKATALLAPGGQRTGLTITTAGWLEAVTNPAGETHTLAYHDANGLLASFKTPEGATTRFDYDGTGRLTRHRGADGEERTLTRTEGEFGPTVTVRTAAGKETKYSMEVLANGDRRRTVQEPSGAKTVSLARADGVTELTEPDGTKTTVEYGQDPRWGAAVRIVADKTVTVPSGKSTRTKRTDTVSLRDPRDPFSIVQLRSSFETDGKASTWTYSEGDAAKPDDQTVTQRSAQGRETQQTVDRNSRVLKQTLGTGVAPIEFGYDDLGRPKTMKQGTELTTFVYDARHRLERTTNAAGDAISYVYDNADRVTEKHLPGTRVYRYGYDHDGNVTSLTMPNGKVHRFTATGDGRAKSYTPPGAGAYVRTYSTERTLDATALPSGAAQTMGYDTAGRLTSENHVQSRRGFSYDGEQDRFKAVTRELADGSAKQAIAYGHDGMMPERLEFTGAAAGLFEYTIGDRVLPTTEKLTVGGTTISRALEFDADRLATKVGPFTIERQGPAGAVSKITDGKLALSYGYDGNGRPATRTLSVGGTERFYQKLSFDNAGRAGAREERVDGGALDALTYTYDGAGQLRTVKRGATVLEDNTYDANGNRLGDGAGYDDRDRLTARGGRSYTWDADGYLKSRGADTFDYSRAGELLSATVGGATVTYAYDAYGRRTAAGTTKYLYGNPANAFQVTATVAGDGTVTTYFYDADDRLFAAERAGERYYVGTDPIGSPRLVVRASDGAVVRKLSYDAYGVERDVTGSFELPIGYAGGLRDAVTGLVRFGARDYDPVAGRFTAADPTFFRGSAEGLYLYANNNPITQKDPSGLGCGAWSMYATFGGGIQICRDNKLDRGADWSICVEGGVGGGGGFEADLVGGAQSTGFSVFAEATAKLGMVGATVGGELDLGCMNAKASAKGMYGFGTVGIDTTGSTFAGGGQNGLPMPGAKLEGKIGIKGCKKFGFI